MEEKFNYMKLPEPVFHLWEILGAMRVDYINMELAVKRGSPSVIWRNRI
jgi:hypothetical protein